MVRLGYSPGTAGWMAQINPLCYSGPKSLYLSGCSFLSFSSLSLSYFLFHDNSCLISIFLFYDASLSFAPVPFRDRTENCILTIIIFARVSQKLGSKMLLSVQCSLTLETRTFDVPERSREKKIFS